MIYDIVNGLCKKKHISICALEKKAGIGNGTIAGWRDGSTPTIKSLQAVADALGEKLTTLLEEVS